MFLGAITTFVFQLDDRSAFFNAHVSEESYIEQPECFAQAGTNGGTLYCKLQKCLYGLQQEGREWNKTLTQWFLKNEFTESAEDHYLFRCDVTNGSQLFVLVLADDILYFPNNNKILHDFKAKLSDAFSIDDRGKMTWFLGCNVEQSHGRISLNQRSCMKDILRKSPMFDCKPVSTPTIPRTKQSKSDCPIEGCGKSFDVWYLRTETTS